MFGQTRQTDQAHRLREMMARRGMEPTANSSCAHVIAVTSGKGGVGKTLVAANLAIALAARDHRVVLFDMDMGLANADIVLGLEVGHTWSDMLSGRRRLEEVMIDAPGRITLVPGASGVARLANLSEFELHQLRSAMEEIEHRFDVVVLDCGAGISRNVLGFASMADTLMVISTPEPTALTDAYAMIKAFAQSDPDARGPAASLGSMINMADSRREGRETYERLAGVTARFLHLPLTDCGYVLRDEHVAAAVKQRYPVILKYPRCSASACLMATAARLSRDIGGASTRQSLFYRVMNMFL